MTKDLLTLFNNGKRFAEGVGVDFYKRFYKVKRDNALSIEDFKQEALAGLWYSLRMSEFKYDSPSNQYLRNGILMFLYNLMYANRNSIAIASNMNIDIFDNEDFTLDETWIKIVNDEVTIKMLLDRYISENPKKGQRNVDMICKFYGLLGEEVLSMNAIAALHQVTRMTVYSAIKHVLAELSRIYERENRVDGRPLGSGRE